MSDWTIAITCCCINVFLAGMARLAPLLFVVSMERYSATRQEASFPFVLCYFIRLICGPLTGFLGNKLGLRLTTIIGCVACSLGIGLCFFAESIIAVTVLWGCVYGLGMGFGCPLLSAILSLHFKENLTKANGLAYFGSSLGGVIFPPVVQVILKFYGISGTFLILGGLTLNSIAIATLLKVPDSAKKYEQQTEKIIDVTDTKNQESCEYVVKLKLKEDIGKSNEVMNVESTVKAQICSLTMHDCVNEAIELRQEDKSTLGSGIHQTISIFNDKSVSKSSPDTPVLLMVKKLDDGSANYQANVTALEHGDRPNVSTLKHAERTDALKSKLGSFHIFCDPTYFFIVLTQSIYSFGVQIIWTIIIDYIRDKGMESSKEIYFLVCLPVSDMIGRLGLGFLIDGGYMTITGYCVACFFVMALSLCFLVWSKSFLLLMISLFMFSLITGGIIIGLPGVVTSNMKREDLSMAMSSRGTLCALFSLAISPLIGL